MSNQSHPLAANARVVVYVGSDLLGDALLKLPLVRALRHALPAGELIWVAGTGASVYAQAFAGGLLDRVIERGGAFRLWSLLHQAPVDLLIDTQRGVATSLFLRSLPVQRFVSGTARFRLSQVKPPAGYARPRGLTRQLLDLMELGTGHAACPATPLPLPTALEAAAAALLPAGPIYIGLVPGAGGRHKCWPLERFIAVAQTQAARGRVPVFILGPAESDWRTPLAAAVPAACFPLQAAEGTPASPGLTIALGRRLAVALANDCGGGHLIAAADCPLISLFGPTDPEKFAPWSPHGRVLSAEAWGGSAINLIPVEAAIEAVEALL